jgi:hypothetical protein
MTHCTCKKPQPAEIIAEEFFNGGLRMIVRYVQCRRCGKDMEMLPEGGS